MINLAESDLNEDDNLWIGMSNQKKNFSWSDDSSAAFKNWNRYEPNNKGGREQCVEVIKVPFSFHVMFLIKIMY